MVSGVMWGNGLFWAAENWAAIFCYRAAREAYARGELSDEDYDSAMDALEQSEEERLASEMEQYSFGGNRNIAKKPNSQYNKYRKVFFEENVFPPYNKSHSDSHEVAERWARSEDTQSGECRLISHRGVWYRIQAFDDLKYGYQIMEKIAAKDYEREAMRYGTITGYESLQDSLGKDAPQYNGRSSDGDAGYRADYDGSQHGRENHEIHGLGSHEVRRTELEHNRAGDRPGSRVDRTGENGSSVKADADEPQYSFSSSEILAVQGVGRKSVNSFTSADIKATEGLARRYWTEMREKSPFFRAWFGDWRVNDRTPVQVANKAGDTRGIQENEDTGWSIQVSGKVFNETRNHAATGNRRARAYLPYINDIVKKAVLLDSYTMADTKEKSSNSLLMHSLYAVADAGNGSELLKLYVEEMNDPNRTDTTKRAYQLQNIEVSSLTGENNTESSGHALASFKTADIRTVADLFAAVKSRDANFNPKPASKIVNEDGTPMVVYHGTSNRFTQFKDTEISPREGSIFFAQNREDAEAYSGNGTIMEVYVNLQNPIDYNDMPSEIYRLKSKKEQVNALKKLGYDGWYCDVDSGWGEVSAFYPEQIKSATDNVGAFNRGDPDIQYSFSDTQMEKKPLAEFMGQYVKPNPRMTDASVTDDEAGRQAHMQGYPVIDGVQVVPFQTRVHCTDPILNEYGEPRRNEDGTVVRRNNHGLVIGRAGPGHLVVAFNNKGLKSDRRPRPYSPPVDFGGSNSK